MINMYKAEALCVFALLCTAAALPSHQGQASCTEAERCCQECETIMDGDNNHLCHCSGNETGFPIKDRPQIVYLTFDDAFTAQAESQFYRSLFNGTFKNPNGCAIRATHFITQSYTDYELVNQYWHMGHEMAAHSITHRNDAKYWQELDVEGWKAEMVGVRKMIGQFAALDPCEVRGTRAPFLQGGGDNMFQMLAENNFLYDCSWPTRNYGYLEAMNGLYPYTLDYKSVQDCPIKPCPKCSWPGIWEQPMIDLEDEWYGSNPINPDFHPRHDQALQNYRWHQPEGRGFFRVFKDGGVCECVAEDKTCNPGAVPGVFCKLLSQEPTQCSTEQVDPLQVQMIQQVLEPPAPFLQGVVWGPLRS